LAQEAYNDPGLTPALLLANTPNIKKMRSADLESISLFRKMLEFKLPSLAQREGGSSRMAVAVGRLIEACSDDRLKAISEVWASNGDTSSAQYRSIEKNTRRFLKAARFWPFFFDIAYEIGKESSSSQG
jgi:hypothetical protein